MSLSHSPQVVTDGLTLTLDAANIKSYQGSGTVWNDASGNGKSATLIGSPTFLSKSFLWDGTNAYATTNLVPSINQGTFCAWINMSTLKDFNTIIDNDVSAEDWEFWVYASGRPRFRTTNGYTDIDLYPTNTLAINTNYFMTITYTATSAKMYINGAEVASDTTVATRATPQSMNIAGKNNTRFNGYIGYVSVYNRSLSSVEVLQNFNALRGRYGL